MMSVVQKDGLVKPVKRTVQHLQFPITPAYAFTDYRLQGQTISAAIIDIACPPTGGKLNQPNVYVVLSRCSGRDNIQILRDFDRNILKKLLEPELTKEDEWLEALDSPTERFWDLINQ
ncbi:hypothetical protein FRC10_009668 [Ceratobasidium sp. 414]|nr:hypothetical protein FRC10_009668 [Ceratobasidium sp. 414]